MRKFISLVALIVVVGAIAGGMAMAASKSPPIQQPETISATFTFGRFKFVDERPLRQESTGDQILFRGVLEQSGTRLGFAVIQCTGTFPNELLACVGTAKLGRGQIVAQGLVKERQRVHAFLAVTGGTGHFRNARGTLEVQDISPNKARFTFRLLP
jgi:hypothetical protein